MIKSIGAAGTAAVADAPADALEQPAEAAGPAPGISRLTVAVGILTVIALEFAFLIGGLVVTEQVFNLNGLGLLFVQAVAHRDYTLTQALVLLVAFVFIFVNFLMDLMYAWLDPRIRFR